MFRHLTPWVALAALGGFAIAYSAYWWVAAGEMRASVERWITDWRQAGYTVDHGEIVVAGFPFSVDAEIPAPQIEEGRGAWAWASGHATLHARPWTPTRYMLTLEGPHRGRLPIDGRLVTLDAETQSVTGQMAINLAGRVRGAQAAIVGLVAHARELGQTLRADQVTVQLDLPADDPQQHDDPAGEATVQIHGLTLPEAYAGPLGTNMQYLSTRLELRGPIAKAELEPMLSHWRDRGGAIEVRWLKAEWGPLTLNAEGTVALDERMRPLGALSSEIGGLGPTMDALAAAGLVTRNTARLAGIALGLLARTPADGGAPVIGVPIAAQNGELFLGPVKVAALPPVIPTDAMEPEETTPATTRPEPVEASPLPAPGGPPTLNWSQGEDQAD